MNETIDVRKEFLREKKRLEAQNTNSSYFGSFDVKICCEGCKEQFTEDSDFSGVEYVKTKRGSHLFFHTGCSNKIWR